jgi:hypothetical protein
MILDLAATQGRFGIGNAKRQVKQNGNLSGNTQVAETIGSIAGDFQVDRAISVNFNGAFMIEPRHSQPIHQFLVAHFQVNVLFQPFPGDDHLISLLS